MLKAFIRAARTQGSTNKHILISPIAGRPLALQQPSKPKLIICLVSFSLYIYAPKPRITECFSKIPERVQRKILVSFDTHRAQINWFGGRDCLISIQNVMEMSLIYHYRQQYDRPSVIFLNKRN